ncbi:MAG: MBL fold metallo-hydrolase [Chloroflexi bacterium]|nr:MBL fold metallo-hydrolase [Chloroflexota bacterium]
MTAPVKLTRLRLPPYDNNCYILTCPETNESLIVDAPSNAEKITEAAAGTKVRYIFVTHRHQDHWGALADLRRLTGAEVAYHPDDTEGMPLAPDLALRDGQELAFGNQRPVLLHTPGHTPGSMCLTLGDMLISGDTLFVGGPGRTARPEDLRMIIGSITRRLFVMPDLTQILPGHGEGGPLGPEKTAYALFAMREHPADLRGDVSWAES